jgi:starch synthase (maltosyl-transferring)
VFRVDNPHTKPFRFWDWVIARVQAANPDVIFLAEAFARPAVMYRLAKGGFTQSYTYFAWKNTRRELEQYFTELTRTDVAEYFRPNAWPNTPDILNEYLQVGGRPAFAVRAILAGTLCASYGIYGPAFELVETRAVRPGSEEYLDSEKYQKRAWDLDAAHSLRRLIARLNRARRAHPALQFDRSLHFHPTSNEQIICYSKRSYDGADAVLVVANLDPFHRHSAWLELDLAVLGLDPGRSFAVRDLLADAQFLWTGPRNFVDLEPAELPAHVFAVRSWVRTEADFDYFA